MTFKEWMKNPRPDLDKLSEEAERKRTVDEESMYEDYTSSHKGGNQYDKI